MPAFCRPRVERAHVHDANFSTPVDPHVLYRRYASTMLIPGGPAAADAHADGGAAPVIEPVGGGSGKGSAGKAQKTRAIGPGAGGHTPVRTRTVDKPRKHPLSLLSLLRKPCSSVRNWQWTAAGSRGTKAHNVA